MRVTGIVVLVLVTACAEPDTSARIARLQARQADQDRALDQAEIDVARLSALWLDVALRYEQVAHDYALAEAHYHTAMSESSGAESAAADAIEDWERARRLWRLYRTIVLVAIALEAGRYEGRSFSCEGMSTAAFRRLLISQGKSLVGMDIDHIVPRSLGGADHPMNYQVIKSSINRSLGARWDADKCLMPGRQRCGEALAVSRQCGSYDGPWF